MKGYKFITKLTGLPFIEEIWLYGSRGRRDNKERSDLDLALICPQATDSDWQNIVAIIENADTLLKIDYIRFDSLNAADKLKKNIISDKYILYQRQGNYMSKLLWQDHFENLRKAIAALQEVETVF